MAGDAPSRWLDILSGRAITGQIPIPDPDRKLALQELERPTTKVELRRLLGMFGFYRAYVIDFASIAKPLTDLTGNDIRSVLCLCV